MRHWYRLAVVLIILGVQGMLCAGAIASGGEGTAQPYSDPNTVMSISSAKFLSWARDLQAAPEAYIDPELALRIPQSDSYSLLPFLRYVPAERSQGGCGNCWLWAGTGMMEIALAQYGSGARDRLSVQYPTSCGLTGDDFACCGGTLDTLRNFYIGHGLMAVPWSNVNAEWEDTRTNCDDGMSGWHCPRVFTCPHYPIESISNPALISTTDVPKETAIANIKNVLLQRKAVYYGFWMPTNADNVAFHTFWHEQNESALWNPNSFCGHVAGDPLEGHAVVLVGYVDVGKFNRYWICVNSWGAPAGRPNGLFRLSMNMDYRGTFRQGDRDFAVSYFETMDVTYDDCFVVKAPTQEDFWTKGTGHQISWKTTELGGHVSIGLLKGGRSVYVISPSANNLTCRYYWTIPASIEQGFDYEVRVAKHLSTGDVAGRSCQFSIVEPDAIQIVDPTAESNWIKLTRHTIRWRTHGPQDSHVSIQLLKDGRPEMEITPRTSNDGSFDWEVPKTLRASSDYQIGVYTADARLHATSPEFAISELPSIEVTSPTSGDYWWIGPEYTIRWTATGTMSRMVAIRLLHEGVAIINIASRTVNDGSCTWVVPKGTPFASNYVIQVETVDGRVSGYSSAFEIGASQAAPTMTPSLQ